MIQIVENGKSENMLTDNDLIELWEYITYRNNEIVSLEDNFGNSTPKGVNYVFTHS